MKWVYENWSFLMAILGGAFVSVITIDTHNIREAFVRTICGVFCALVFTDPIVHMAGVDPEKLRSGIAGLLAISGYGLAKWLVNMKQESIVHLLKTLRGGK